jgi:hypothetical protein
LLAAIAYRVFSTTLRSLMNQGEVGYDVFAATTLQCGSVASWYALAKHALGRVPIPVTPRARWLYLAMATSTAYILAMPTLVSAMTGYASVSLPSIKDTNSGTPVTHDCNGLLLPAWGEVADRQYGGRFVSDPIDDFIDIAWPGMPILYKPSFYTLGSEWDWIDCTSCSSRGIFQWRH